MNLTGNGFAQTISGNAGANILDGKGGADTITGGTGTDVFVFSSAPGASNVDTITDYNVANDQIQLNNAVFADLVDGALAASAFASNLAGQATTAALRIIYESDTGFLWFDADGTGATARVQFADLAGGLGMTASEFLVI